MTKGNVAYNADCLPAMRETPDKYYDLAIVDPVYGDVTKGGYMKNSNSSHRKARAIDYHIGVWNQQKTEDEYFKELFRVSKNQVIWGGELFCVFFARITGLDCLGQEALAGNMFRRLRACLDFV